MNPQPEFSVVIPCFQPGRLILESVASVMDQGFPPELRRPSLEVIVIDDHSQDQATQQALSELERRHPDVRVLRNPENLGVSATRNRGITAASGRWIKFLDADDFWTHDHLELTVRAMDQGGLKSQVQHGFEILESLWPVLLPGSPSRVFCGAAR